jgi:hypothetical protein
MGKETLSGLIEGRRNGSGGKSSFIDDFLASFLKQTYTSYMYLRKSAEQNFAKKNSGIYIKGGAETSYTSGYSAVGVLLGAVIQ